jgi:hypothetical protein
MMSSATWPPPRGLPLAGAAAPGASGRTAGLGRARRRSVADRQDDWRCGMRGQGVGGYGGQYAGMAAGLRGTGGAVRPDPAEMVGSYGESGGSHGGGGYGSSDQRIHDDVCERLRRDDIGPASDIYVRVEAGVVALDGMVRTQWAKRRAGDLAIVRGVREVRNNLRVRSGRVA